MALIEIENLKKTYAEGEIVTPVLRGISLAIHTGEFVAIMGPSGSGKSTLLHILGFLDTPTGGTYLFDGKSISEYTDIELAQVRNRQFGFVFQAFNLLPRTSVLDNVKLPLLYSEVAEGKWQEVAERVIADVGLSHRAEYEPSQLSGGEKQRAAIARALVNEPQVIFADEPTGNLDSVSGELVMGTIQKMHKERGHTIVLITHETYTAEYAERIIRLKDGKIESDSKVAKRRAGRAFLK